MNYQFRQDCQIDVELLDAIYTDVFGPSNKDGVFVEVGAYDGVTHSNTWGLSILGWKGLLIEPNPEAVEKCKTEYAEYKNIEVECCAASDHDGYETLYFGYTHCGSIIPEAKQNDVQPIQVRSKLLNDILVEHNIPERFHLIVIDAEYSEHKVLSGFDLNRWNPVLAIVEMHEPLDVSLATHPRSVCNKVFNASPYRKIYIDNINTIFVRNDVECSFKTVAT